MKKLISRKFISFVLSLIVLAGILVTALLTQTEFSIALASFLSIGLTGICALCIGYVINQASLERFVSSLGRNIPGDSND
jgi:ribose/xylose/arabinose/galactoside ABC-type transport system permease subunit